jgi:ATP adenylyltransferase
MAEVNNNLWAPWRMEYIHLLEDGINEHGCFLCAYSQQPEKDADNHVIWRSDRCITLFNKFPYSNGHLLIAPHDHVAELHQLEDKTLCDMMRQVADAQKLLKMTSHPHGFNVGMNFGRCAGAGLPDHVHAHIVPRWEGDTNFMPILGNVRVIPESIDSLYNKMREAAAELGLPPVGG